MRLSYSSAARCCSFRRAMLPWRAAVPDAYFCAYSATAMRLVCASACYHHVAYVGLPEVSWPRLPCVPLMAELFVA
eukprot:3263030-Lingulodinium_polyedra.AAC.1